MNNAGGPKTNPSRIQKWGQRPRPDPVDWLVHHLFQDDAENLLGGEPGVGKSWISGDLAVSVATGTSFLERRTKQGSVLIINFDDPSEALPRSFAERAANARGYDFKELDIYYWQPDRDKPYPASGLLTPDVFQMMLEEVQRIQPRLILIDAFSSAFPGLDGNKAQDVIQCFEFLRQLRVAAVGPCCLLLVDHTPKQTVMDSKRRGISGSQQKHARVRTVHIVSKLPPSEVSGDDVLQWEVFKANAAPYQEPFGIDRELNTLMDTATLQLRDLPSGNPKTNRATTAAITYLQTTSDVVSRQDLINHIVSVSNVSQRSARRALESDEFLGHPNVQQRHMAGRGNPLGYFWHGEIIPEQSPIEKLRERIKAGTWPLPPTKLAQLEAWIDSPHDPDAQAKLDTYLDDPHVRAELEK